MATQRGPDGSVRLAMNGTIGTHPWACTGWVQTGNSSTMSQVDLNNLLGAWSAAFGPNFGPHQASNVTYTLATATGFYGGIHALHSTLVQTGSGTATGPAILDNSACFVVSWTSTVYWRGGKPRMYLPGVPQAACTNGYSITATEDTALTTSANTFHTAIGNFAIAGMAPIQHGFVSFRTGNQPRPVGVFFPITGAVVHPRLGTQRRRLGAWTP